MNAFAMALAGFVLLHVGISATGLRARLVSKLGAGRYRIVFSLVSAGLLAWLMLAYGAMRADPFDPLNAPLWSPPVWLRHVSHVLVMAGVSLAVAGLLTPGPTLAGFEGALKTEEPARGVLRITRHPFLWGVALWSGAHLLANGERFALMLFGGLGLMVLLGTRSIDRKGAARDPEHWARFAALTSNIPFAAILQGRNRLVWSEIHWRLLVGLAVFALIAGFHGVLFGVSVFSTPS